MMTAPKKKKRASTLAEEDRVIDTHDMAIILKPSLKSPKVITKSKVDKVFEWARKEFEKTEELYFKRKSQIILETARKLEDLGIEKQNISYEIKKNLKGYVDDSYVQKVLIDYPEYKDKKQANNAKGRKSGRNIPANPAQTETANQSQTEERENNTSSMKRLSNNQITQIMTTTEGRMGYVNEEHECFKDEIIKQLETEIRELKGELEEKK